MSAITQRSFPWPAIMVALCVMTGHADAQPAGNFYNPVLAGFYPDPSVCKVGDTYYCVTSSFAYFPGIPIFQSTDLAHWKQIGHVMDRPGQLNLDGAGVSRGLFAPSIRYHDGLFYVVCTLVDKGGNFVVTAKNAKGPWSNPVWLPRVNGIDPSPFFDTDGKAYIVYNSIPPNDSSLYDGHRTIRLIEFNAKQLKTVGPERILVNGGTDLTKRPVWIEAPHLFRTNGYYYLIAAEGGTGDWHSEVVFRSRQAWGPYEPYEKNPILTQRHLDPKREHPITCTGHADVVETDSGSWWAVFLGCRPYNERDVNTGRETFLAPVTWTADRWPVLTSGNEEVRYSYPLLVLTRDAQDEYEFSGNLHFRDDFSSTTRKDQWTMLRTPRGTPWYSLKEKKGMLTLRLRPETCADSSQPSFFAYRQQHLKGYASAAMRFIPKNDREKSGIAVFQNEARYYYLCVSKDHGVPVVQLFKASGGNGTLPMELLASDTLQRASLSGTIRLKIEARGGVYAFSYAPSKSAWVTLKDDADATWLSTRSAGGFVGCMYALYATSLGARSTNTASFDWFDYQGNDDIYQGQ